MASHFNIVIGDRARSVYTDSVSPAHNAFAARNVSVHTDLQIVELRGHGCIIGHLFTRSLPSRRVAAMDTYSIEKIISTNGRSLLTDYWGGYVALLLTDDSTSTILRDPSGIMPCYWRINHRNLVFSNDIESVACLADAPAAADLHSVAMFLASSTPPYGKTGLCGVHELMPGEALIATRDRTDITQWWSPWDFVTPEDNVDVEEYVSRVRNIVSDCVATWASCFDSILLGVSGGLDSSIVAATAASFGSDIRCLNMFADDPEGDERHYAKALTDSLSLPLITGHFLTSDINISRAPLPISPWPNASYFMQATQTAHQRINAERPVDAYFSGNGGDNVFCSIRSSAPFLDRFITEGPGNGLKATLRDLCDLTETAAPTVLKIAWRNYRQLGKPRLTKRNVLGLSADIFSEIRGDTTTHPWLNAVTDSLPGKLDHVSQIARAYQSHELYPRHQNQPHIAPLLSQPIIETCLAIPSWFWIAGGANRAIARKAFSHLLPPTLVSRTSKGGPTGFLQSIFHENQKTITNILNGGVLAQNGVLDSDYINKQVDPTWRGHDKILRLLELAVAETWCQAWNKQKA